MRLLLAFRAVPPVVCHPLVKLKWLRSYCASEFRFGLQPVVQIMPFCPIALLVYLVSAAADLLLQFGRIGVPSFRFVGG